MLSISILNLSVVIKRSMFRLDFHTVEHKLKTKIFVFSPLVLKYFNRLHELFDSINNSSIYIELSSKYKYYYTSPVAKDLANFL